ncbi:hypothetical protein AgCh_018290 [Apium graveolens]
MLGGTSMCFEFSRYDRNLLKDKGGVDSSTMRARWTTKGTAGEGIIAHSYFLLNDTTQQITSIPVWDLVACSHRENPWHLCLRASSGSGCIAGFGKPRKSEWRGKSEWTRKSELKWELELEWPEPSVGVVCMVGEKVRLPVYKLEGDAQRWWRGVKATRGEQKAYLREFHSIVQHHNESITDYMARFIRGSIISFKIDNVEEVVDAAKDIEKEHIDFRTSRVRDCTVSRNTGGGGVGSGSQQNPTTIVFALTANQEATYSGTISVTLLIGRCDAYVLFDTGSTHSIVSLLFVRHLGLAPSSLYPHMSITTPMEEVAFLGHIVSDRGIELDLVKVEAITNWPRPSNVTERWLELLKDYDANIQYHPGKANAVANFLSRKNLGSVASLITQPHLISDLERLGVELYVRRSSGSIVNLKVEPNLVSRVKEAQKNDKSL